MARIHPRRRPGTPGGSSAILAGCFAAALLSVGAACTGKGQPSEQEQPATMAEGERTPLSLAAPAHGFTERIAWQPLGEALELGRSREQPVMLVVHASWCPRCKELKPTFEDAELRSLSEQFVMVNADQDLEPESLRFAPDGDYIPRVVFIDSKTGEADPGLRNDRRSRNLYFYTPDDDLVGVMKRAIARYGRT